ANRLPVLPSKTIDQIFYIFNQKFINDTQGIGIELGGLVHGCATPSRDWGAIDRFLPCAG
ncbi:MAG: hypothetical protein AAFW48_18215, partial [Pseudomonadota bacterium]